MDSDVLVFAAQFASGLVLEKVANVIGMTRGEGEDDCALRARIVGEVERKVRNWPGARETSLVYTACYFCGEPAKRPPCGETPRCDDCRG